MKKILITVFFISLFFLFSDIVYAQQLTILYTGQTYSTLFPCHCPLEPAGGVARRATMIKKMRSQIPNLVLLEAGQSFAGGVRDYSKQSEELDRSRASVYFQSLKMMDYDAIGVAKDALNYGGDFFKKIRKATGLNFLGLNLSGAKSYIIKDVAGLKVAVIGLGAFDPAFSGNSISRLKELIKNLKRQQVIFIILLSDNGPEDNSWIIKQVSGINCIISSSLYTKDQKPVLEVDNTLVASSYWQGRRISRLDLDIQNGQVKSYNYSEIKLTQNVADDARVAALLAQYPYFKR